MFVEHKEAVEITEEPTLDEAGKLLLKAADCIEANGHLRNDLGRPGKGFCVLGAVIYAESGDAQALNYGLMFNPVMRDALARLRVVIGMDSEIGWNNRPERTKDEVVSALRAAAALSQPL